MRGLDVRLTATLLASVLTLTTVGVQSSGSGEADAATATMLGAEVQRPDEISAAIAARQVGKRVAVTSLASETEQVYANPDGTFTLEQTTLPTRVRHGNGWVPVDTTLVRQADGTIAPKAAVLEMSFSGGGSGPAFLLEKDGAQLALSWPTPLPAPTLEGDTATYSEVLPGVDLKIRADVQTMSHVLVVKTAEAARNPAIATVRYGLTAHNIVVREDHNGNLSAVDNSGKVVFGAPPAKMWDSGGGAAAAAKAPASNAKQATVPVHVDGKTLTFVPDQALLTGPDSKLPIYIDPAWGAGTLKWIHVNKKYPNEKGWLYDRNDGGAKMGYDSYNGTTYRSYFQMNTKPVNGKHIQSAYFRLVNWHSWSCNARPFELWVTGTITPNTSWNAQPARLGRIGTLNMSHGYSASCPDKGIEFNALSAVQDAARGSWANLNLMLVASNESDTWAWKKFNPNASLTITYNSIPKAPSSVSTDQGVPCVTGANRPKIGSTTPILRASLKDDDNHVKGYFEWWVANGARVGFTTTDAGPSGATFQTTVPAGKFANGSILSWRVRGDDGVDTGPYGPWCEYAIDTSAPDKLPGVASTDYPEGEFGGGVGRHGAFTFSAGGIVDVTKYEYWVNDGPKQTVAATGADRSATALVTPDQFGDNRLSVRSVDGAMNFNEPTETGWIFRFDPKKAKLWLGHALPVLLVLVDLNANVAYWEHISSRTISSTGKGYKG